MQPFNESNFDGLVNCWYEAAERHEGDTIFKMKLYDQTELAASTLERLVKEGSTEQAKELANIILQSFDSHGTGKSEGLIRWIGANTLKWGKDVKGAYKPFHHLFEALKAVDDANSPRPPEDSNWTYKEVADKTFTPLFEIFFGKAPITENLSGRDYTRTLAAPDYIDIDSAAMNLLELSDASIQGHKHGDQIIPDDIMNLVVQNSVRDKPAKDHMALQLVSKKMSQQVANAFRGPLTELNITTADQAIEYAKKFGKELQYLDISGIDFSDGNKLKELIKYLPKLNTFLAKECKLDKEAAQAIAASEFMKNLSALNLSYNQIGPAGAQHIAASIFMQNLTALDLSGNQIGPAGAQHIAASIFMQNLTALDLSGNQIGPAGAQHIAASEFMKNLSALDLIGNQIGPAGAQHIAASIFMKNLSALNLIGNRIGPAGAQHIAASIFMQNLTALDLSGNQIGPAGAQHIAASIFMKNLSALNLSWNEIGDAGAQHIAASEFMKNLSALNLSYNQIGPAGAQAIADSEYLKNTRVILQ